MAIGSAVSVCEHMCLFHIGYIAAVCSDISVAMGSAVYVCEHICVTCVYSI